MDLKTCPVCEARWVGGKHYWATGRPGNEKDLAGLVCNKYGRAGCCNPMVGVEGGDTWEDRAKNLERLNTEFMLGEQTHEN